MAKILILTEILLYYLLNRKKGVLGIGGQTTGWGGLW
jgi:hypothetical protein